MDTTTRNEKARLSKLVGTRERLLAALEIIDGEGWDGQTGRDVLDYAMRFLVEPTVRGKGLVGVDADQATASAWQAAWEALSAPSLRSAVSPWGVIASAVRYAVLNERMEQLYGTDYRSAWRVHRMARTGGESGRGKAKDWLAVADAGALRPPASYTELVEAGFERAAESRTVEAPGRCLTAVNELLVQHGWDPEVAAAVIAHVIEYARPNPDGGRPRAHGWREMSAELGIPPWQARRVTVLLLGAGGWPGLVERVAVSGPRALREPAVIAAVQATCDSTLRPPARAATNISARTVRQIALAS